MAFNKEETMDAATQTFSDLMGLAIFILLIIAWWKIFEKAGEKGWKAIIPIYNGYILYKISWKTMMFWIMLALGVVGSILMSVGGVTVTADGAAAVSDAAAANPLVIIGCLFALAAGVIEIIQQYKLSKSFGHGIGYALGLIFLSPIFELILAFGKSEYKGPQA